MDTPLHASTSPLSPLQQKIQQAQLFRFTDTAQAELLVVQVLREAEQLVNVNDAAWASLVLAQIRGFHRRENEILFECLFALFQHLGDTRACRLCRCYICWYQTTRGESEQAWAQLQPVLQGITQVSDLFSRIVMRTMFAYFYAKHGDPDASLFQSFYTLAEARQLNEPGPLVLALHNVADALYEFGGYDEALPYLEQAHQLVEQHALRACRHLIASIYSKTLLGLGQTQQALTIITPLRNDHSDSFGLGSKAAFFSAATQVYCQCKDWPAAKEMLQQSELALSDKMRPPVLPNLLRAMIARGQGLWEEAQQALDLAVSELPMLADDDIFFPLQVYLEQAHLHRLRGDTGKACIYFEKYQEAVERRQAATVRIRTNMAKIHAQMVEIEQARETERLRHAKTDRLTGLINREALREIGEDLLLSQSQPAILMLNINRFQSINEALGPELGDAMLIAVAKQLSAIAANHPGACLGRMHADQFCLIIPNAGELNAIHADLIEIETHSIFVRGETLDFSLSLGIALAGRHGSNMVELMRNAEIALRTDKHRHQGWTFYHPQMVTAQKRNLTLLSELRQAARNQELRLYLQPKVHLCDGMISSAEALIRWQPAQQDLVPPTQFIPFAEQTGIITVLTQWIMARAMQLSAQLDDSEPLQISVNVSTHDLRDPGFVDRVAQQLQQSGANPAHIRLEITESGLMEDPDSALSVLHALRKLGLSLAIDDFGTGYSSLAYLQRMPVAELKIDRSFVSKVAPHSQAATLLKATIDLGHSMGLSVVAEGPEVLAEWQLLRELGCDYAQGWFASPPMPEQNFLAWRQANQPFGMPN